VNGLAHHNCPDPCRGSGGGAAAGDRWGSRARQGTPPVHLVAKSRKPWLKLQVAGSRARSLPELPGRNPWVPREESGTIEAPIGAPADRKKLRVVESRRAPRPPPWQLVERLGDYSLKCASKLETGPATHQIRVHAAHLGHRSWAMPLRPLPQACRSPSLAKALHCAAPVGASTIRFSGERLGVRGPCRRSSKSCWRSCGRG